MAKCPISQGEFQMLSQQYKAPKEGEHVKWREFSDQVDEVFTKKGLEQAVDHEVGAVRTNTVYGRSQANAQERELVNQVVESFREVIRRNRLDAKSFF